MVEMKFLKNKKFIVGYLLVVLVLSVGVSYAFFRSDSSVTGDGATSTLPTADVSTSGILQEGNININDIDFYPGHQTVASIKLTGTGEDEPVLYDIVFEGTNTFETPIYYTIYKLDENIDVSFACEVNTEVVDGAQRYYEECVGNNIESLGEEIGSGTLGSEDTILKEDELMITTLEGTEVYYYVVIEYPNLEESQNSDMDSKVEGSIVAVNQNYQAPEIITAYNTTEGNNDWYTSVEVIANIRAQTEQNTVNYCITTSDDCIPDQEALVTDQSFRINLDSNADPQKVCIGVVDEYGVETVACTDQFQVDNSIPVISTVNYDKTEDSLTIHLDALDDGSGISRYYYSIDDGGNYENGEQDSYTFLDLSYGTTYPVRVYVEDVAGNISSYVVGNPSTLFLWRVYNSNSATNYLWNQFNIATQNVYSWNRYNVESYVQHGISYGPGGSLVISANTDWRATQQGWDPERALASNGSYFRMGSARYPYQFNSGEWGAQSSRPIMLYQYIGHSYIGDTNNLIWMYAQTATITNETVYEQGSTSYGSVTSTNSSAYPNNGYSGSYWYVYSGVTTNNIQGSTNYGTVSSTNSGAYPSNGISGSYWYVSAGSEIVHSQGEDLVKTVTSPNGDTYPDDGYNAQDGLWYVKA